MANNAEENLQSSFAALDIPQEFARYEGISETQTIIRLEEWKKQVYGILSDLRAQLSKRVSLSLQDQAQVIFVVAPFDGEGPWTSESTREQARGILGPYDTPEASLLEQILGRHVKPIFQANPHPSLNAATGRMLPRPAGGPLANLDYLEGQTWKSRPGAINLVSWCVQHCDRDAYERLWHLIIPPVMTLLDDFEAPYKLGGIRIVSAMLHRVPADLLQRTGIDGLLFSSLRTSLTYLHNPETPRLIRAGVPTAISLVLLTTTPGSAKRFDQLCALLGDGIIGSVWFYAIRDPDTIEASLDVLPEVVHALGIGTARYLKAIIPQLVYPLVPAPENAATKQFQLSSMRALAAVITACAPRMHKWKGTILDSVLKCWVTLVDAGVDDDETKELKHALQRVCSCLLDACPSIAQIEYARLLEVDAQMFAPLVRPQDESGR